jgi:hypothetical protein
MKNLTKTISIFILFALFSACTKKTIVAPKPSLIGIWKGKFGIGANVTPNQDVVFEIKDDGSLTVYNGADIGTATVKGSGTYMTINGFLELTANYKYPGNNLNYAVQMKTTDAFQDLTGTWTFDKTAGGKIELKKQL